MTDQELKHQRNKARAALELAQMKARAGLVTPSDLATISQTYQDLMNYQPPPPGESAQSEPGRPEPTIEMPQMPAHEFTRLLEELTLEKAGYHKQMAMCCNSLKDIPDGESAKDLVDQIDQYYDARTAVAVKINYLKANGRLPQDLGNAPAVSDEDAKLVFMANLPADKYELAKKLGLTLPNLSKARTKLERAKDPVVKQHYSQKVARLEVEVSLIRAAMKALD